ncbi:MAG: NAD-dependent epimerase/dehydratase family protein [Candidatus Peribacteraceae bacterium]|nr:NAD-dependent epimerase/dehydratase family protein [Candidatus Peribacteraceae bacterium]
MKIFLTGAAGFIGYHTAVRLLERGDTVVGYDNVSPYYDPGLKRARLEKLKAYPNFTFIEADILDRPKLAEAMKGAERVIHLAAIAGVRYSMEHPEEYIAINIQGFFHVIDEVKKQQIPGLVYASSSSIYGGNTSFPSKEDDKTENQLSLYGQNKKDNELMARTYWNLFKVKSTGLRFFTVYGPLGRPDMALFLFTDAILKDQTIKVFGEGKMQRDFTYVEDIVSGIVASVDKNYDCEVFNLGCGRTEELMDYIGAVEKAVGKEAKKEMLPMQPGDTTRSAADLTKAKAMLGFEPKTPISEGVPKFVAWYREYYGV